MLVLKHTVVGCALWLSHFRHGPRCEGYNENLEIMASSIATKHGACELPHYCKLQFWISPRIRWRMDMRHRLMNNDDYSLQGTLFWCIIIIIAWRGEVKCNAVVVFMQWECRATTVLHGAEPLMCGYKVRAVCTCYGCSSVMLRTMY